MIDQKELMHLLNYNCLTGVFTWINPTSKRVKSGGEAGTLNMYGYIGIKIHGLLKF